MKFLKGALLLCFVMSTLDASAQEKERRYVVNAKGKRVTVIDFDEVAIDGRPKTPEGFLVQSRQSKQRRNFLEPRVDFQTETLSTVTLSTLTAAQKPE